MLKNQAFNLYTDSQYTAHGLHVLETVPFLDTNSQILQLFIQIQLSLRKHTAPYFLRYLRAHTGLLRHLSEGNAIAYDRSMAWSRSVVNMGKRVCLCSPGPLQDAEGM